MSTPILSPLRAVVTVSLGALLAVVLVLTIRPGADNAGLVTQILGFASTILMATLAYLKSSETHSAVNGKMEEFIRLHDERAILAAAKARAEGRAEGRAAADARTDALADKAEELRTDLGKTRDLMEAHDAWERDRLRDPDKEP